MNKFIFTLLSLVLFVSCDKSDDNNPAPDALDGKWELQGASCFCFYPEDFDFGAHKINFNVSDGISTIENSEETLFITATGNYDFVVQKDTITIDGTIEYIFEIIGNELIMSNVDDPEIADDEITLTYKRF